MTGVMSKPEPVRYWSLAPTTRTSWSLMPSSSHASRSAVAPVARGEWVLCDRFVDASIAYQGAGRGLGIERVQALRDLLLGDFRPDLTLLLDLPVELGMQRIGGRGAPDRFESEQAAFFERVRATYHTLAVAEPTRFRVLDAARDLVQVRTSVIAAVDEYLGSCGGVA